jgi:hypothetical protein
MAANVATTRCYCVSTPLGAWARDDHSARLTGATIPKSKPYRLRTPLHFPRVHLARAVRAGFCII